MVEGRSHWDCNFLYQGRYQCIYQELKLSILCFRTSSRHESTEQSTLRSTRNGVLEDEQLSLHVQTGRLDADGGGYVLQARHLLTPFFAIVVAVDPDCCDTV